MELQLDGAAFELDTQVFEYILPKPFGPDKGEAFLKIKAKPASTSKEGFKQAFEKMRAEARLKDVLVNKLFAKNENEKAVAMEMETNKWVANTTAELWYDHCVVSWETNIQNNKKDLAISRENFIDLSKFPHPDIAEIFAKFGKQIQENANFAEESSKEADEQEAKN